MLEQKKTAAFGIVLGVMLMGGTAVQASAQATQDTSKASSQDTSAYSTPQPADTGVPSATQDTSSMKTGADTGMSKMGADTGMSKMGADTGMSSMHNDSSWTDTSKAGKKAWKKKHHKTADSTSAK